MRSLDGGETWDDCSRACRAGRAAAPQEQDPERQRNRGHDRRPRAVRQRRPRPARLPRRAHGPLPQRRPAARAGRTWRSAASRRSPTAATSASHRTTRARSTPASAPPRAARTARSTAAPTSAARGRASTTASRRATMMARRAAPARPRTGLLRLALRPGLRHPGRRQELARVAAAGRRRLRDRLRLSHDLRATAVPGRDRVAGPAPRRSRRARARVHRLSASADVPGGFPRGVRPREVGGGPHPRRGLRGPPGGALGPHVAAAVHDAARRAVRGGDGPRTASATACGWSSTTAP